MRKRYGFTLIELLAVIVVLAIIAIIAVPVILNVIEKANKGAFEDTAYGIIDAGEIFFMDNVVKSGETKERYDFEIKSGKFVYTTDINKALSFKGKMPNTGMLQINSNGKVAIAICNDDFCACKSTSELKVTIKDTNCSINSETGEIENNVSNNSTPVGTIISYMGNNAPNGYLKCDGSTYNISEYQSLANQIKNEFGSFNYWGGDGTTTFAVPNLQGEFLRGYSSSSENSKTVGVTTTDVGIHQDATNHIGVDNHNNGYIAVGTTSTVCQFNSVNNNDTSSFTPSRYVFTKSSTQSGSSNAGTSMYTSRPTNTAVLYCIKY